MVILVLHPDPAVRTALQATLTQRGFGPILSAASGNEARAYYRTAGPAVAILLTAPEFAGEVSDWREAVGPVRAVYLADDDLPGWAQRLPGELLLPAAPLPVDALAGWVTAVAAESMAGAAGTRPAQDSSSLVADECALVPPSPRHEAVSQDQPPTQNLGSSILGDYELLEVLREDDRSVTYRALQRSVQRVVVLERLRTAQTADPDAVLAFRALVRAQAAVVHPKIAAVYEAQEQDGRLFYTREWIEGRNLAQLRKQRQRISQESAFDLLAAATEAVAWLDAHGLPRRPLVASDVVLGRDGLPRVANIAVGAALPFQDEGAEVQGLVAATEALLDPSRPIEAFQQLATRVRDHSARGLRTWSDFGPAVAEIRRHISDSRPPHTRRLSAATQDAVAAARWRQRRGLVLVAVAAAIMGLGVFQWLPFWRAPKPRPLDELVRIPGGSFIYQAGEMREVPEFWIGKHEVTIAQYAEFLDELERAPGNRHDHPRQPSSKTTHRPAEWDALLAAARRGGKWRGLAVDLNCPVTGVDYWDAWAFAHWQGRRLPSELEWEKAARSTDGRLYPWGREPDAPRANTGADFGEGPNRGSKDGHTGWAPVDAFAETDVSPYGVVGMAGNVSEWTASTMLHPEILDQQVPVLRGGSYSLRPIDLTHRRPAASAEAADAVTGFRVAADRPR